VIDVYAFATPNSLKIPIALEELGLAYRLIPVNLRNVTKSRLTSWP
jgi:GSH-dependent disulfide-bond oxidoreductase